jgi:thiamine biosynthesis lipoprotein ApbE
MLLRRSIFIGGLTAVLLAVVCTATPADDFQFSHENVLGTSLELTLSCADQETALQAEQCLLQEIDRLSEIFSHYSATSEFSRLTQRPVGSTTPISAELSRLLCRCEEWTRVSQGAFNPAVELMTQRWKQAARTATVPSNDELQELARRTARAHWRVQVASHEVTRLTAEPLSLNAIAKGTILDLATQRIQQEFPQIDAILLNIGGDIRVAGERVFQVQIPNPARDSVNAAPLMQVALQDQAIATSGSSERFLTIGGKSYSHLIDPRTGVPCEQIASASVIAPDAETADVLATICCVLPADESLRFINTLPMAACYLVTSTGTVMASRAWPAEEAQDSAAPVVGSRDEGASKTAATPHDLLVEFEISKPDQGGRYRRPYVAVWVEDADGFPVKTLSLFLMADNPGPRWHRDLRRWYSSDQVRQLVDDTKLIGTISKPSRNPGKYKVSWDGTDDQGQLLKDGAYTLYIEAAREHGTYQLMKQAIQLGGENYQHALKGNVEIGSASVTYRRK